MSVVITVGMTPRRAIVMHLLVTAAVAGDAYTHGGPDRTAHQRPVTAVDLMANGGTQYSTQHPTHEFVLAVACEGRLAQQHAQSG